MSTPAAAVAGTVAVIRVGESTVKLAAGTPPNSTDLVPSRLAPASVTRVPAMPTAGAKELIEGVGLKLLLLQPRPFGVVTPMVPTVAVGGTVAVISADESTVKLVAATPSNATAVASVKFAPSIVTWLPATARAGVNERTTGAVVNS